MKIAGGEDVLSYWTDKKGTMNVLIQPKMNNSPVKVTRAENTVNVNAFVDLTSLKDHKFYNIPSEIARKRMTKKDPNFSDPGVTGDKLVKEAFKKWEGVYYIDKEKQCLNVKVDVTEKSSIYNNSGQRFLKFDFENTNETKDPEARFYVIGGWSIDDPGDYVMTFSGMKGIPVDYSNSQFTSKVTHEIGHILGIGDAYEDEDYDRQAALITNEVPINDIMRHSDRTIAVDDQILYTMVTANDIEMMLEAFKTNKKQYFTDYGNHKRSKVITDLNVVREFDPIK
jgi:hypothetical protein